MANLKEDYQWPNGVYQWEETDLLIGGEEGIDNVPPKQLAGRTQFLSIADLIIRDIATLGVNEAQKTIRQRIQEGVAAIYNRGVIRGCAADKAPSGRKVVIAAGGIFANGREMSFAGDQVGITVPSNNTGASITYFGYLSVNGNNISFHITEANGLVPADGISICRIVVPAGNTASDLTGVTLTSTRTLQGSYPQLISTWPYASVALQHDMLDGNYTVSLDVVSHTGQKDAVYAANKATNGFRIYISGSIDAVVVRWTAVKISL